MARLQRDFLSLYHVDFRTRAYTLQYTGLRKRPERLRIEYVDAMFGEMLKKRHPIGEPQRFMRAQPGDNGRTAPDLAAGQ